MQTRLTFQCPQCNQGLTAKAEKAGRTYGCPNCSVPVTVPTTRALVPVNRQVIVPEIVEYDERPRVPARRRKRRNDQMVPVKMKIPGLPGAEFEGAVDEKTSNAVTTTVVGGFLVALGAIIFAMFGGKGKSA